MRRTLLIAAILLPIAPAAAQEQASITGFETYVVVAPAADEAAAQRDAARHCARYNRFANFRRMDGDKAIFDCALVKIESGSRSGGGGLY
jgi:hypothetical protein